MLIAKHRYVDVGIHVAGEITMDEQKKQKILVGVMAALVLGTGGVWYMNRDDSSSSQRTVQNGSVQRKKLKQSTSTVNNKRRKRDRYASKPKTTLARRQPVDPNRIQSTRKPGRRPRNIKVTKEKIDPAS